MKTQIQLLLGTIALSVLIWVYADQAGHETGRTVVQVSVNPPAESDLVTRIKGSRPDEPNVLDLGVDIVGSKSDLRKWESTPGKKPPFSLEVPLDAKLEPGVQHRIDIRAQLSELLAKQGLSLPRSESMTIEFALDRYVRRKIDLLADPGNFKDAMEGNAEIVPATVQVRVLESELKRVEPTEDRLVLPIEEQIANRSNESKLMFTMALPSQWHGVDAVFKPDRVNVTVNLVRKYKPAEHLSLIPLRVAMPPDEAAESYAIEWQNDADLMQDLDVRVPIGKPAIKNTDVIALIILDKSDLPTLGNSTTQPSNNSGGWIAREIRFVLPSEMEDVKIDSPPRTVKFRLHPATVTTPSVSPTGLSVQ